MTDAKLRAKVYEGVILDRQRAEIDKRLKELKADLIAEAKARSEELEDTGGGGKTIRFEGADGCIAVVTFPARTLKSTLDGEGKTYDKIKDVAGTSLNRLFTPAVVYKPIDGFRDAAASILGRSAARLIKLCESDTKPRVNFETADRSAQ